MINCYFQKNIRYSSLFDNPDLGYKSSEEYKSRQAQCSSAHMSGKKTPSNEKNALQEGNNKRDKLHSENDKKRMRIWLVAVVLTLIIGVSTVLHIREKGFDELGAHLTGVIATIILLPVVIFYFVLFITCCTGMMESGESKDVKEGRRARGMIGSALVVILFLLLPFSWHIILRLAIIAISLVVAYYPLKSIWREFKITESDSKKISIVALGVIVGVLLFLFARVEAEYLL